MFIDLPFECDRIESESDDNYVIRCAKMYFDYNKFHSVGLGFEFLSLNNTYKGNIKKLRNKIYELILKNAENFNSKLNIGKAIDSCPDNIKLFLAKVIVLKNNALVRFKKVLINSCEQPNIMVIQRHNIKRMQEFWEVEDN